MASASKVAYNASRFQGSKYGIGGAVVSLYDVARFHEINDNVVAMSEIQR